MACGQQRSTVRGTSGHAPTTPAAELARHLAILLSAGSTGPKIESTLRLK
jgi:hypothetical protein